MARLRQPVTPTQRREMHMVRCPSMCRLTPRTRHDGCLLLAADPLSPIFHAHPTGLFGMCCTPRVARSLLLCVSFLEGVGVAPSFLPSVLFCFLLAFALTSRGVMWCCVVLSLVGGIACVQRLLHNPQYDHFLFSQHAQAVAYYTRHTPHRMSIAVGGCTATQTNTWQTLHAHCSCGLSTRCEWPHQHGHPLPW